MPRLSLSVLMTVYTQPYRENGLKFLKEAVESILGQTREDFEFIIVDDGSAQDSVELMEQYARQDSRIRIFHKQNSGLTDSLNYGLSHCQGDMVARQDADDVSLSQRLKLQCELMESDGNIATAGSWYALINPEGTVIAKHCVQPEILPIESLAGSAAGGGCVVRKSMVEAVGGWKQRYAQDAYLWIKFRQAGFRLVNVEKVLYLYRVHSGRISSLYRKEQNACMWDSINKAKAGIL